MKKVTNAIKNYIVDAILLAYGAVVMIVRAIRIRNGNKNAFILSLVLGLVTLVLAVVIFLHPALIANILMQLTGIALIIEGLALLIVMALKSKAA